MTELGYTDRPPLCQILDFILNVYLKSTPLPNTHTHTHMHAHTHMQSKNQFHLWKHAHKGMIVLQASPLHPPHPTLQAYHPEVTLGFFMVMLIHISCNSDLTWSTASWAHVSPRSCLNFFFFFSLDSCVISPYQPFCSGHGKGKAGWV